MKSKFLLACIVVLTIDPAYAGDDRYQLRVESASGSQGAFVVVNVRLDSQPGSLGAPSPLAGWSYGICHSANDVSLLSVANGPTTATVNGGSLPDFNSINSSPAGGTGFTVGVVISFFGTQTLAPGTQYIINRATYSLDGTPGTVAPLVFCDSLGSPPVQTVVVVSGGLTITPVTVPGSLSIEVNDDPYRLLASDATGPAGSTVTLSVAVDNPQAIAGFSFGLRNDSGVAAPVTASLGSDLESLNGGAGADFFAFDESPPLVTGVDAGVVVGCVFSLQPPFDSLAAGEGAEIARVSYQISPGLAAETTTEVSFSGQLSPSAPILLIVNGEGVVPSERIAGSITGLVGSAPLFVRGDVNADGALDLADVSVLAAWLFGVGPGVACEDVGDIDDSGQLAPLVDLFYLVAYLFQGGPVLPPPFLACGSDPTPDALMCEASTPSCP